MFSAYNNNQIIDFDNDNITYVYGPLGLMFKENEKGERFYYSLDESGSPIALTDNSGTVMWEQDYYPFGEQFNNISGETMSYLGMKYDNETGLYGDPYDPLTGRWLSPPYDESLESSGYTTPLNAFWNEVNYGGWLAGQIIKGTI